MKKQGSFFNIHASEVEVSLSLKQMEATDYDPDWAKDTSYTAQQDEIKILVNAQESGKENPSTSNFKLKGITGYNSGVGYAINFYNNTLYFVDTLPRIDFYEQEGKSKNHSSVQIKDTDTTITHSTSGVENIRMFYNPDNYTVMYNGSQVSWQGEPFKTYNTQTSSDTIPLTISENGKETRTITVTIQK